MMSLSHRSVTLASAHRPSRETVSPPRPAIRENRNGRAPKRRTSPIPKSIEVEYVLLAFDGRENDAAVRDSPESEADAIEHDDFLAALDRYLHQPADTTQ